MSIAERITALRALMADRGYDCLLYTSDAADDSLV